MKPFFFGSSQRPLFGIHHPAAGDAGGAAAVVLCNPFGQEAVHSHRIYRVLAAKLSRAGMHVLRFDYSGTGDSAGDGEDGRQAQWVEDILEASDELASTTEARRVSWVGLRYGATLAALAAERTPRELGDLVLWDPVVRGRPYLDELAAAHADYLRVELPDWTPPAPPLGEAIGFPLPPALSGEIESTDLRTPRRVRARRVTILVSKSNEGLEELKPNVPRWAKASRWLEVQSGSPWNSDQALNLSLVPIELVDAVVRCLQEGRA